MSQYLEQLANVLRAAGLVVVELDGWETRGRSNNAQYADGRPWCVMWHHTASAGDGAWDADYCTFGSPDAPLANLVIDRDGTVFVCAAGPTNTNGKGGPLAFSKGTVPADSMNTYAVGIEISNGGTGMAYPAVQMDACFAASTAITAAYGLQPDDVAEHVDWAPGRKIDPATAAAVAGAWHPADVNTSGSWSLFDLRAECVRRAGTTPPPPTPTPTEGPITMYTLFLTREGWPAEVILTAAADGIRWNQFDITGALDRLAAVPVLNVSKDQVLGMLGDRPGIGPCPFAILPDYSDPDLAAAW